MTNCKSIKINKVFKTLQTSSVVHNNYHPHYILKGDSGATNHYVSTDTLPILSNIYKNENINVQLPDNTTLSSTHTGTIKIPHLSNTATTVHILPGLQNTSLMSLGQLADDGCVILLNKKY